MSVTLVVGTAFFAMNQLGVILDGRATALVWVKAALTYLTPLLRLQLRAPVGDPQTPTARVHPTTG